jgi:hypothetical protein
MVSLIGVGAKIPAAFLNALANAANAGGLVLIPPSAVTGTGVTKTPLGKVTFITATSVNVAGVFSSTYDNYLIKIDATMSGLAAITMQLASGGTADTSANYDQQAISGAGTTTPVSSQTLAGTSWTLSAASQALQKVGVELDAVALATVTTGSATAIATPNPPTAAAATAVRQVTSRVPGAYDGFVIAAASGTMSGTVRVYGYNNG